MPNASASISGLFLISLDNPDGNASTTLIANMFISDNEPQCIGWVDQFAYVSGDVALIRDTTTSSTLFDIRGATITPITTYTPHSSNNGTVDSPVSTSHPAVIHAFEAYNFALAHFSVLGTMINVAGNKGSDNRAFSICTEVYNRNVSPSLSLNSPPLTPLLQSRMPNTWTAVAHVPNNRRWQNTSNPFLNTSVLTSLIWLCTDSVATPPIAHFELECITYLTAPTALAAVAAAPAPTTPKRHHVKPPAADASFSTASATGSSPPAPLTEAFPEKDDVADVPSTLPIPSTSTRKMKCSAPSN
jgi:hypothetical protein